MKKLPDPRTRITIPISLPVDRKFHAALKITASKAYMSVGRWVRMAILSNEAFNEVLKEIPD